MYPIKKQVLFSKRPWVLLLGLVLAGLNCPAQQVFTDGAIVYAIDVPSAGSMAPQAVATLKAGQLTYRFKNHLFRSDMRIGPMEYINIHDNTAHSALSLIKGGAGKNYLVRMSAADVRKEAEKYDGLTFTPEPGSAKIAGYTCKKAVGQLADGKSFTVYYTEALQPPSADYNPRFKGLDGLPLKFEVHIKNDAQLTMTATSVKQGFQPSSLFEAPSSGFRELTYAQLQQLRGR